MAAEPIETKLICAPDEVPAAFQDSVSLVTQEAMLVYNTFKVPYYIIWKMAEDGFTSLGDLADRWVSEAKCRETSPSQLLFDDANEGWTEVIVTRTSMRLGQAVRKAKNMTAEQDPDNRTYSASPQKTKQQLVLPGTRDNLLEIYKAKTGVRLPLEKQPSKLYLEAQLKLCSAGEIGYFPLTKIVPYVTETHRQPTKRKRDDDEEEWLKKPDSMEAWKDQLCLFRDTLLMCVWHYSSFKQFDLEMEDIDKLYDFILGRDMAKSSPPPSLNTLQLAERAAWRRIAADTFRLKSLKQAVKELTANPHFWQKEVFSKQQSAPPPNSWQQSTASWRARPHQSQWQNSAYQYADQSRRPDKGKGKGKGKGRGKGKGKGKKGSQYGGDQSSTSQGKKWPDNWAHKSPKGVEYCKNFFLYNNCKDKNCGRSHSCPKILKNGWTCTQSGHHPDQCPAT